MSANDIRKRALERRLSALDRTSRIAAVQAEMRDIEKKTGREFGEAYIELTERYAKLKTEYGRLLLARDKERRPEAYRSGDDK